MRSAIQKFSPRTEFFLIAGLCFGYFVATSAAVLLRGIHEYKLTTPRVIRGIVIEIARVARKARTLADEARGLAGLNRNYVGDVERGRRNPCFDNIIKLADGLNVSPPELFRPFDKRK